MKEMIIEGQEYVCVPKEKPVVAIGNKVLVRSRDAGVFYGTLAALDEKNAGARVADARRIWYWSGAASLSQLSLDGTKKPSDCKFPAAVSEVVLYGVCEILPVTEKAAKSIESVPVWTA